MIMKYYKENIYIKLILKSMNLCKIYEIMVIETNEIHNIRRCSIRKI